MSEQQQQEEVQQGESDRGDKFRQTAELSIDQANAIMRFEEAVNNVRLTARVAGVYFPLRRNFKEGKISAEDFKTMFLQDVGIQGVAYPEAELMFDRLQALDIDSNPYRLDTVRVVRAPRARTNKG